MTGNIFNADDEAEDLQPSQISSISTSGRLTPRWADRALWVTCGPIVALITAFTFVDFDQIERAEGWLVPAGGLVRLTVSQAGGIDHYYVEEGDVVDKGAAVVRLRLSYSPAAPFDETSPDDLFQARMDSGTQLKESQSAAVNARISATSADGVALREREQPLRDQLEIAEQRLSMKRESLDRLLPLVDSGYISRNVFLTRRSDILSDEQGFVALQAELVSIKSQITNNRADVAALQQELKGLTDSWIIARTEIEQQRIDYARQQGATLHAPVPARVVGVSQNVGQSVMPGQTLALLAPVGSALEAEVFLPSKSAAHVRVGQRANLTFEAFPRERAEQTQGVVSYVSQSVLAPSDIPSGAYPGEGSAIRVIVRLPRQSIQYGGKGFPLMPGMKLRASIITEDRSLFAALGITTKR